MFCATVWIITQTLWVSATQYVGFCKKCILLIWTTQSCKSIANKEDYKKSNLTLTFSTSFVTFHISCCWYAVCIVVKRNTLYSQKYSLILLCIHITLSDITFIIHSVQYDASPLFEVITASTLLGRLSTRFRNVFLGILIILPEAHF